MRHRLTFVAVVLATGLCGCAGPLGQPNAKGPSLAHNVYFALNEDTPAARDKLVADCYTYLSGEPGIFYFAAGEIVESHTRDVNVRDWDVSLHIVFKDKASHDAYQKAAKHFQFIDANEETWKTVRVFDSFIE